jgi:hypothetical protein
MQNLYDSNFDALDTHFDNLCLFSYAQAENIGNPKCYDCNDPKKSQTDCREIELKH